MSGQRQIVGAILAGGAGTRVGDADKGLLPLGGRPLIAHVLDALRAQCEDVLIVANRNRDAYAHYAPVVADEVEGFTGPLAGIVAAFDYIARILKPSPPNPPLQGDGVLLIVPVDCPDPPRDLATRLHEALRHAPYASCAFAHDGRGPQPLFALYRCARVRETLLPSARAALVAHASPVRWHVQLDALPVDFSDSTAAFHNLNTLGDFREYERTHDF